MGVCVCVCKKCLLFAEWLILQFCQTVESDKTESLDFTHMLNVSFQIHCVGVQRPHSQKGIFIPLFMNLTVM